MGNYSPRCDTVQVGTNSQLSFSNIFTGSENDKKLRNQLSFCLPPASFQYLTLLLESEDGGRKFLRNISIKYNIVLTELHYKAAEMPKVPLKYNECG
jgi:hypothetical protein